MDATALSMAAREMRKQLSVDLKLQETEILIGHPHASVQQADQGQGKHYVNLFFYRVEYDGYPADGIRENPFYIRVHCLITAFAKDETIGGGQKILAGENDLRLIGGVMHSLHRNPLFWIKESTSNKTVAQIETIISNITLDDINKIWSTQGDTAYRPSVAYELTLLPIPVSAAVDKDLRVAGTAIGVSASLEKEALPPGGLALAPIPAPITEVSVDQRAFDWAPRIFFWTAGGLGHEQTLSNLSQGTKVRILGLGRPDEIVDLHWDLWDKVDGWQGVASPPGATLKLTSWTVDLLQGPQPLGQEVELPSVEKGQMSVWAVRTISRPHADPLVVRSNPLLVTISA